LSELLERFVLLAVLELVFVEGVAADDQVAKDAEEWEHEDC
jgi:hypothetical protein